MDLSIKFLFGVVATLTLFTTSTWAIRATPDLPEVLARQPPCPRGQFKVVVSLTDGLPTATVCRDTTKCDERHPPMVSTREPQEFEDRICCPGLFMDIYYDTLNNIYRCYLPHTVEKGKTWLHTSKVDLQKGPQGGHGMEMPCKVCSFSSPPLFLGKECSPYRDTVCCKTPGSDVISISGKDYCIPPDSLWHKNRPKDTRDRSDKPAPSGEDSTSKSKEHHEPELPCKTGKQLEDSSKGKDNGSCACNFTLFPFIIGLISYLYGHLF